MELGHVLLWGLIVAGGAAAVYGLHCLCLWLEKHGWLYYKHNKPTSSAASCFVAWQQILEPPAKHVLQVKEQKRHHAEVPGQDDSPPVEGGCRDTGGDRKPA